MNQSEILHKIKMERKRQDVLHPNNNIEDYFAIVTEEYLEVARAMQGEGVIVDELIQLCAAAVRWLEEL